MPLTAKFVRREGWYSLSGYNKMADNTFPNVYTVLSGLAVLDEHAFPVTEDVLSIPLFSRIYKWTLHNTLRHLLQLNATTPAMLPALDSCPSSQSLLHPLPVERSCDDACIVEHWCTCNEFVNVTIKDNMRYLAQMIVTNINMWMLKNRFNQKCQPLILRDVDKVEVKKSDMMQNIVTLRILFRTYPKVGKFRTTLKYNVRLERI
ncbi:hypothetical protein AWZ03_015284, partial [Drosophila navojoa]